MDIIDVLKIYLIKNPENDVLYLALKSTRMTNTVTRLYMYPKTPSKKKILFKMKTIIVVITTKIKVEFDDGSEWTLSKCLTHANRTSNFINFN